MLGEFEITHETQMVELQGESTCCIVDHDLENKTVWKKLLQKGFEYNLKGVILKTPQGYHLACRFMIRGEGEYLDYKIAPPKQWMTEFRKTKKLAIIDITGKIIMVAKDVWTGAIDEVLQKFYTPNTNGST